MMDTTEESFIDRRHKRRSFQALGAMLDAGSPVVRDQQISKTLKRRSTALDVQKSLQLLDESVSSPSARTLRTPGGTLKHSSYVPKQLSSGTKFDVSTWLGPTPKKTPKGNKSFQRASHEDSMQSSFHNLSGLGLLAEDDIGEDVTTSNVGLLLHEDPGISASHGLYCDFLECLRSYPAEGELFSLVEGYEKMCRDQVMLLHKLVRHASRNQHKFQRTFSVLHELNEEEATWKLIKNLFRDRQETAFQQQSAMDDSSDQTPAHKGVHESDLNIVNELFGRDPSIREAQIVVDWLESNAQHECDNFAENIKFFADRAVGYENARHRLQNPQSGMQASTGRNLITELDPDAVIRQNKLLDDLDKEDEDRLLQYVFVCIRAGQLEKAQRMCMDCGQAWRAATLEGWRLFHDPNYASDLGPDCQRTPIEGNPNRDIWKLVCWNITQDPRVGIYEKAIYSALSGNLRGILPVCKSWLDYMWAYFRVLVDTHVEEEIRAKTTMNRALESLPGEYWEKRLNCRNVFREIEACDQLKQEANSMYHLIQKHVILGDIHGVLEMLHGRIRSHREELSLHCLRFMAHFVLFLRSTEQQAKESVCVEILETYVEELMKNKHNELVAYYVAKLPPAAQLHWYARFLEGITEREERQHYLDLGENAGLDIAAVTKRLVENIRSHTNIDLADLRDNTAIVDTRISKEDEKKISAIDWLVFDVSQRAEAMKQANALMRTFIGMKKLDAAKAVFVKLPQDTVDVVYRTWLQQTGSTELPAVEKNAIREYLCIKAYLDAMESFNDWVQHYHHGKPQKPSAPGTGVSFTEKVAHEHRLAQYEQEQDRWQHNLMIQTQTTKEHIYNVLLFADGGWMVDETQTDDGSAVDEMTEEPGVDGLRGQQMEGLRRLVLPALVFLLHNVLHSSKLYTECLTLADIVSAKQHQLFKVFRQEELQRLMELLRESSLKLLDQGQGPLGYDLE